MRSMFDIMSAQDQGLCRFIYLQWLWSQWRYFLYPWYLEWVQAKASVNQEMYQRWDGCTDTRLLLRLCRKLTWDLLQLRWLYHWWSWKLVKSVFFNHCTWDLPWISGWFWSCLKSLELLGCPNGIVASLLAPYYCS